LNQLATYIGKKQYNKNFWDTESYLKLLLPKWKKWQKVWKNRIQHYTPRSTPHQQDVTIEGIIEKWDPKKGKNDNQTKSIDISPMFGPDVVELYKTANQGYNPAALVKSASDAENVRALFALELKFMVGCDCKWTFPEHDAPTAAPATNVLASAVAGEDDAPPVVCRLHHDRCRLHFITSASLVC
jgi:hypothetical protein